MMKLARVLFWIVVCASLLANAVVLGMAWRAGELRQIANGGTAGFADLPAPIRAEFRDVLKENRAALTAPLADLGEARRDMFDAAAARPYDRAAVEAAMERVRTASTALQAEGQRLLLQAFDNAAAAP
jgi:Spy/CpxP family protein refolding chaperone